MALPQAEQKKFHFSRCSCDASLSQEREKKVPASPCCHLQTPCHILSQQGSIFATVPRRQLHMRPLLVEGTPKNNTVGQLLGEMGPWTRTNGSAFLLKHLCSPFCWSKRQPELCQGGIWAARTRQREPGGCLGV